MTWAGEMHSSLKRNLTKLSVFKRAGHIDLVLWQVMWDCRMHAFVEAKIFLAPKCLIGVKFHKTNHKDLVLWNLSCSCRIHAVIRFNP